MKNYIDEIGKTKDELYAKYLNDTGDKDVCKKYKFLRNTDTISFNRKINGLGIAYMFDNKKYDLTSVLKNDLENVVTRETNITIGIEGPTGSGKSEVGMKLAYEMKMLIEKLKSKTPEYYVCFTMKDLYLALKKLKRFDIVLKDESPKTVGEGSRKEKWSVDNILHIIRFMQNIFIFIDPIDIKMSYVDIFLESAGMDIKNRVNRFLLLNREKQYLGIIYVKLHDDEEFRQYYKSLKEKFVQETLETGGTIAAVNVNIEEGKKDSDELQFIVEFLEENYSPDKVENKMRNIDIYKKKEEGMSFSAIGKYYKMTAAAMFYVYKDVLAFLEKEPI